MTHNSRTQILNYEMYLDAQDYGSGLHKEHFFLTILVETNTVAQSRYSNLRKTGNCECHRTRTTQNQYTPELFYQCFKNVRMEQRITYYLYLNI